MSKELEALEALKNIRKLFMGSPIDLSQQLDIIETALKRNIELEEENKLLRENNENLDENYYDTWYACERLKECSDYALMFIDGIYCLVDTTNNKFDVIDTYKIQNYGIIDNGTQKKLKALEIIKEKGLSLLHKSLIISSKNYDEYMTEFRFQLEVNEEFKNEHCYTQDEYESVKEVLL